MSKSASIITSTALSVLLIIGTPGTSSAWSNGVRGPNSYGTHDWILHRAIKAVGQRADWVRMRVAVRATDDCDTKDGLDHFSGTWWHVYDQWGSTYGDAPEAARIWYRRARNRLAAGKERSASRALGYLAHIVGDVANPMHTDSSKAETSSVHSGYEHAVDTRSERSDNVYKLRFDGRDLAKPGALTLAVARKAHVYYKTLVRAYDRHGYSHRVHRITRRQLRRGANAVADLIWSMSK